MKIAVLLTGSGVYDGSEIHEAVLTLLSITRQGAEAVCLAPDINQHHVINHINGKEMLETRNVLVESARIARGNIKALSDVTINDFDALVIPGGFGAPKNLSKWAFEGAKGEVLPEVKSFLMEWIYAAKPTLSMCISPVVLAKVFEGKGKKLNLTVGTSKEASPYNISEIAEAMESLGVRVVEAAEGEILFDEKNKIISTPCYMQEASILQVAEGIEKAVKKLVSLV